MILVFLIGVALLNPQNEAAQALLDRAVQSARLYTDTMRNLTAQETRTTELFDKNGKVERRRGTVADVVVHRAGPNTLAEYRRVREVDGKTVKTRENSLDSFLKTLASASSTERELQLIQQESARYDLEEMQMRGMILNQAWPLEDERFRAATDFQVQGRQSLRGRETVVVQFEIPSSLPDSWRVGNLPELLKAARLSGRGKIWIDAETAEIWRYETETLAIDESLTEPAVLDRMEFEYTPSRFGIPTPTRIVWTSNTRVSREKGQLKAALRGRVTAVYSMFQRYGTDVKIVPLEVR